MTEKQEGKVLTAADLFSGGRDPFKRLEIPEIVEEDGAVGVVFLKSPSAGDVLDFASSSTGKGEAEQHDQLLKMISQCVVNQFGEKLFADTDNLRNIPFSIFKRLMDAVNALSGVGQKEEVGKG